MPNSGKAPEESSPGRRECKNGAARRNFCILLTMANSKWSRQAEFLHFADYGKFMESPEKSSSGRRECKNGAARRNFCILPAMLNSWKARNAGRSAKKEPLGGIFAFCWLWRIHGKPRKTADRDNCPVSVCDENPTGRCFQIAAYSALIFPHLCGTPSSLFRFSFH